MTAHPALGVGLFVFSSTVDKGKALAFPQAPGFDIYSLGILIIAQKALMLCCTEMAV